MKQRLNKQKIINAIAFCVFAIIICRVFMDITYLFRPVSYDRTHVVGMEREDVDIVYIGGSAAFVYWQPFKAWNDCGYTSYNFATNTVQAENIKAYVEETLKSQNPELLIIGVRAFQYYSDEQVEPGLRNGTDSMDMTSLARYKLLDDYFANRNLGDNTDKLSYYLDIIKYHENTSNLSWEIAWKYIHNNAISTNKGWEWVDQYGYLEQPSSFYTEERAELPANDLKTLNELCAYCKSKGLNVLFVVCPYWITKNEYAQYNTIGDIVGEYGYLFLNTNDYYEKMNLDFSMDFYNKNHVNLFGAEKYTDFLENYISENYQIDDHRGDTKYSQWDKDYQRFLSEKEQHSEIVNGLKADVERTYDIQEQMKKARTLSEWWSLANDSRYSLLVVGTQNIAWPQNIADQKVLSTWGLNPNSSNYLRVINGGRLDFSNEQSDLIEASGTLGIWGDKEYYISVKNRKPTIVVENIDYTTNENAINILIFENNYRRVVGILKITTDENGEMVLSQ